MINSNPVGEVSKLVVCLFVVGFGAYREYNGRGPRLFCCRHIWLRSSSHISLRKQAVPAAQREERLRKREVRAGFYGGWRQKGG